VPWIGFSFSVLAKLVEPARRRATLPLRRSFDRRQMPHAGGASVFPTSKVSSRRKHEPLALLSVGMYGETLPPQDGAPVRMIIPWKYGYKSIKSVVKIRFQEKEPPLPGIATQRGIRLLLQRQS